ncbi:MAG: histidine kinase, partial [Roseateles sp.]
MSACLRLTEPLPTLQAWVAAFAQAEIPVLAETAEALEQMRAREDDVDAHGLGELIATDPLMTLKVLVHVSELRRGRLTADP